MSKVRTALDNIALIDLKIEENKRLSHIVADYFKKETKETDLRKCEDWNKLQTVINDLTTEKRNIIKETVVDS
jgi:FtsZ-binding cell division protein ZapB